MDPDSYSEQYNSNFVSNLLGPFITHSNEWTEMEEWTVEFLCTVDSIIAHGVLIASVPFHPVRLISFNRCIPTSPIANCNIKRGLL